MAGHLYEVFVADTEFSKTINYHVRYQVYCEQKSYEAPSDLHPELEIDEWDQQSIHFILRNIVTGEWCAALRLIKADDALQIPIERFSQIDDENISVSGRNTVELSRLCRPKTSSNKSTKLQNDSLSLSAVMTLIVSAAHYCKDHGFSNLLCLTSLSVSRMMSRQWTLNPVGPVIEHHGKRKPYCVDLDSILSSSFFCNTDKPYRNFSCEFGGPVASSNLDIAI